MSAAPDFARAAEDLADKVLRAAGSRLQHYEARTRAAISLAALDGYDAAFRAGADYALAKLRKDGE